jgi:hypothetical protein
MVRTPAQDGKGGFIAGRRRSGGVVVRCAICSLHLFRQCPLMLELSFFLLVDLALALQPASNMAKKAATP